MKEIDYIWDEDKILQEIEQYIDATYSAHYAGEKKIQTTEYIASCLGFEGTIAAFKFNIMKYADRFGKKEGYNEKDLMKVIHYAIMALSVT